MRIPQKGGHHLGRKRPPSLREKAATSETKKNLASDEDSKNETNRKIPNSG